MALRVLQTSYSLHDIFLVFNITEKIENTDNRGPNDGGSTEAV